MGRRIQGHSDCLICHPDLDKKYAKNDAKGLRRVKASIRRQLQDSIGELLVSDKANDIIDDEVAA